MATHQHPYTIASSDHQMYLQISSNWQHDLLYCCDYSCDAAGALERETHTEYCMTFMCVRP